MKASELIEDLQILDENIAAENIRQPILFVNAARYRVAMMHKRAAAGARLEYIKARVARVLRNNKRRDGTKISEGAVKELVETHPKVRELRKESDRGYEREELAKLIVEAFRQRNSAIKNVIELQISEGNRGAATVERDDQHRKMRATARRLQDRRARMRNKEGEDDDE